MTVEEDDLDIDNIPSTNQVKESTLTIDYTMRMDEEDESIDKIFMKRAVISTDDIEDNTMTLSAPDLHLDVHLSLNNDFPIWAGDSSVRRSPEGKVTLIYNYIICILL